MLIVNTWKDIGNWKDSLGIAFLSTDIATCILVYIFV